MTKEQIQAIKCAYADLVGIYQCIVRDEQVCPEYVGHDWDAHRQSIMDLEEAFDFIEPAPLDDSNEETECSILSWYK